MKLAVLLISVLLLAAGVEARKPSNGTWKKCLKSCEKDQVCQMDCLKQESKQCLKQCGKLDKKCLNKCDKDYRNRCAETCKKGCKKTSTTSKKGCKKKKCIKNLCPNKKN
jgi:hypothetical protein